MSDAIEKTGAHTPGPWRLAENDPTLVVTERLDAEGNCRVVADVLVSADWVSEADARLIAAAPDLLAALKRVGDYFDGESDECILRNRAALAHLVRAAIANAIGGAA